MQPKLIAGAALIMLFCAGAVVAAVMGVSQPVTASNDTIAVVTPVATPTPEKNDRAQDSTATNTVSDSLATTPISPTPAATPTTPVIMITPNANTASTTPAPATTTH